MKDETFCRDERKRAYRSGSKSSGWMITCRPAPLLYIGGKGKILLALCHLFAFYYYITMGRDGTRGNFNFAVTPYVMLAIVFCEIGEMS